MRKFKVVKSWPSGPAIGTIGELGLENVSFEKSSNYGRWHTLEELEGFVEEVTGREGFWILSEEGGAKEIRYMMTQFETTPNWLRFRTKESAEKFAKALEDSHGYLLYGEGFHTRNINSALNDRVK